jgi:hypothetical protein
MAQSNSIPLHMNEFQNCIRSVETRFDLILNTAKNMLKDLDEGKSMSIIVFAAD